MTGISDSLYAGLCRKRMPGVRAPASQIREAYNFRVMGAVINSIGVYCPERVIYNSYFEKYLDTSDSWIKERI